MCPKEAVEVAYAKVEIENHTDPANPKFNPVDPKFKLIIQNEKMLPSKLLKKQKIDLSLNPERSPARFINVSAVVGKLFPQIASHNPYTTRILSGPDNHPETNLIVCIPTIAGKFPFEITAEGLVKWNRGLQNLENLSLDFITPGDIHVIKHICNQSLALKAQRFQNGKGVLMKVIDSMEASLQFFENDGCLLSQSGSITLAIDILLKNLGWVCSRDKLTVNTLKVWNQGILASSEEIACTLSSRLDNPSSGVIVSHANIAEFCESEEPLSGIQKKHLLDLSQSQIPGFKPITVAAIEVENAGVISGSQVTVKDIGISQSVATNKIGGKILATDILHIKINSCINKGLLFSQNQAIIIAKTFLQKLEGRLKTRNLLITTERLNNGGLISAENASLETEHFENTGVVELFGSEEPVTVSGKTVTNQGRMSASALVEIRTSQFKNTLKGLLSSQKLKLITDTIENFGLLEVLEELIVSDNSLTVNQGQITSEGSIKITTARFQQLLEAAQIVSAGALKVTAKSALENHGLLLGQNVTLSASRGGLTELDRQRGRVSRLSRHEVIQNNAGARIVGREGIYLISARVQNFGDLLAQTKECLITVDMSFRNQGRAYAGGKLIVQARTTHNQGCLASSEEIRLSVKQGLKNQNGVITAQNFGFLSVNADGTLLDTQLKLLAEVASGRLVDPKPVTIDAASIENVGMISGSCVTVRSVLGNQQHPQGWIENQANAKIVGTALLNLAAATVHNAGKLIGDQQIKLTADQVHNSGAIAPQTEKNSKLKLEIVASKKVENTGFIKAALLEISTALWVNTGNVNVAKLQVKSYQGVDNTFENTGEVQANVQIDLEMSSLTNQALMETQGNLVAKQSVLNIVQKPKARLISSQNLTLDVAQEIQNAGLISGKKVSLSTVDLKGSIEQLETARVLSEQEMVWQSAKIHHAGEAIVQSGPFTAGGRIFEQLETGQVLAAGRLSVRVEAMTNKGLLASGKKIKMVAEKIVNQGTLSAESDISLLAKDKAQGPLGEIPDQLLKDIQQGKWLKPLPVQLQAEKHIQNEGYISGSQVKLFARTPDKPLERVSNAAKARIQGKEAIELFSVTIDNSGDIVGQESCVIAGGKTPTGETLAAKELDNRGIIAGQAIILHADKIHNKTTGKMNATQSLRCAAVDLENQKECTTKVLELTIEKQLTNEADAQIQCHSGKITAEKIIQQGQLSATEKLVVTATEFRHTQGEVSAPELVINSTDIHLNAPVKGKRIEIRGKNIHITQPIEAEGDIEIFHEGGEWNIASDMLRTKGKVIIHLKDGRVVEPLKVQGSLHYKVDDQAKKPLSFLGDHFVPGELSIQTPTDVMISNKEHYVKLGADDKQNCERISIEARNIELLNGRLVSGQRLKLKAQSAIQLGCRSGPLGLRSALASGDIELDAGSIAWNQIELRGENLTVKAINLDDISSEVFIEQDAQFEVLNSEHRLLVEVVNHGGKQVPFNNNFGHAREKRLYHEQRTLSPPAYLQVGGRLKLGGRTRLFGSMLYCGSFDPSSTLPLQENFIPYLEWVESFLCGHRKVEKAWWVHCWHRETGVPALAAFSEGTGLQMRVPRLAIAGILTSPRIALYNVEAGMVGLPLELHVSVPAPKPFQSRLVLSDYVQSTSLFRISRPASYATVYQPVLPQFAFSLEPIVVAGTNGSLRPNVHHHRCLLTHAQEMAFITKACFKATGQGFLFPGLTPFELLMISKENAKSCLDRAKEGAAFIPVGAALQDPFMVYEEQSLIHGSTEEEWVLKPVFYLPKRFDNPRIRAGALGMFALGDVLIEGASLASSRLLITGDIYGGGSVHIRQFQEVIQARRFSRQKQCVTDTVTESRYFGAKKKTQHTQQEIEVVRSELPSCITGDSIVIEKIARLQQSGGELYAGPGGTQVNVEYLIHLPAITIEVAVRSSKFPGQKSLTHEPKMIPIPNIIHSVGPVEIKVLKAHLYLQVNGQRQTPTQCIIEAEDLSFEQIEEVLRAAEAYRESVERDAARTAKRKQTQGVVKVIAAAALSAVVGPQIGAALKGISFFAENALALSCVKGMTMGFMNSIIAGQNPVKGALTGAAFDMFACKVGEYLGGIDALQGAEKLQEGLANLATTAVATAVQGGDVVQSLAVSLAADQIATRVLPSTLEPSAMQQITQSIARSTAVACLRGVETAK